MKLEGLPDTVSYSWFDVMNALRSPVVRIRMESEGCLPCMTVSYKSVTGTSMKWCSPNCRHEAEIRLPPNAYDIEIKFNETNGKSVFEVDRSLWERPWKKRRGMTEVQPELFEIGNGNPYGYDHTGTVCY